MKCIHCGNNLNIDDEFCNSCGNENVHAVQHRKDMQHYNEDYHQTKRVMFEKSGRKVSIIVKGTIIAVLVCFIIILTTANTYKISVWFKKIEISKNIKTHKDNLDRLEAERDFLGLTSYYDTNDLYLSDDLYEYHAVVRMSSEFQYIYDKTFQLLNLEKHPYKNADNLIKYISDSIAMCYDRFDFIENIEYEDEQYSETHVATIKDFRRELETFIHVYLKVPREDIEAFEGLSYAKIHIIIEGSINNVND